jgi:pyruvate,water dikinase
MTLSDTTAHLVVPLSAVGRTDVPLVGGKGANLGELTDAGLAVPPGFAVTTDAYRMVTGSPRLRELAERSPSDLGAAIRKAILRVDLPDPILAGISTAYDDLGGGAVAVRSSATAEDLPGATFAGQQDTFLGMVDLESVLDAVRRCWASLWSERAIAYRAQLGIDPGEVAIAVVVQRMVPADVAGVLFTADPVTGARDRMVVDASEGLGEAVVSGAVTPDHVVMRYSGRAESYSIGLRESVFRSQADGTVKQTTSSGERTRLLDETALRKLAAEGRRIQDLFQAPQDIEWALTDGELHILQARPMTALPIPQRLNRIQRLIGSVFSDYFSVRPYPMDMSTWVPHGPVGMMDKLIKGLGIDPHLDGILPEKDGVVVQFVPPMPTPTWRTLGLPFRVAHRARTYDPAAWKQDARYLAFVQDRDALGRVDSSTATWSELLHTARRAMRLVDPVTELRSAYLPAVGKSIVLLRIELMLLHATGLMSALISGAPTHTTAGNHRLEELAGRVRANPILARRFREEEPARILERLRDHGEFAGFASDLDAYLEEFGYRETDSPVLISSPTWVDRPDLVIGLVAVLAADGRGDEPRPDTAKQAEAELCALPGMRKPRRRARVLRRVARARIGIAFREDSHNAFTQLAPTLRRCLLEFGARLVDRGVIEDAFDVFHLRFEELEAIDDIDGATDAELQALANTVRDRSVRRGLVAAVPMVNYAAIFPPRAPDSDALLVGTPACAGQATGPVRVVRSVDEFGTVRSGDILVCPYTNPSWTPLFQRAAAVVVDTGGIGSHAAIVARENGIPAVMGTGTGTTTLRNDQLVTVDGTAGTVRSA